MALITSLRAIPDLQGKLVRYGPLGFSVLVAALVIPLKGDFAMGDDWIYLRMVEEFAEESSINIYEASTANAVFDVLWGGLISKVFGFSIGTMRLASMILHLVASLAIVNVARRLIENDLLASIAGLLYLWNPLGAMLSASYMSDGHYLALQTLGIAFAVAAFTCTERRREVMALASASILLGIAYLSRQSGALVACALVISVVATDFHKRRKIDLPRCAAAVVPAATIIAIHLSWLSVSGATDGQKLFIDQLSEAGYRGVWDMTFDLAFIQASYLAAFLAPLLLASIFRFKDVLIKFLGLSALVRRIGWCALAVACLGAWSLQGAGRTFPYCPSWLAVFGLGPTDIVGVRPAILSAGLHELMSASLVIGLVLLLVLLMTLRHDRSQVGVRLFLALGAIAVFFGAVASSFPFRLAAAGPTLDRYLLPGLPFILVLLVIAVDRIKLSIPVALLATVVLAVSSIVLVRDALVLQSRIWDAGDRALELGASYQQLDAGAGWDLYHLYGHAEPLSDWPGTPFHEQWWLRDPAPALSDSTWIVTAVPVETSGFTRVDTITVDQWIGKTQELYVSCKCSVEELSGN